MRLYLNLPRARLRRAAEVALGLQAAQGGMGREWAEALTETDEEAAGLWAEMRLAAKEARAFRGRGG